MDFKIKILVVLAVLATLMISGCLGTDDNSSLNDDNSSLNGGNSSLNENDTPVIIERETITQSIVIGDWVQSELGYKLVLLNNHTYVQIINASYYSTGTWRIENNNTLILTAETWDYTQNINGEYIGEEDVSFGTMKNGVLSFSSINEDVFRGFPAGNFVAETAGSSTPGAFVSINDEIVVGTWDDINTNGKLIFSKDHTFVQSINGNEYSGKWRIEYNNILILNMRTYTRSGSYLGYEDVSYGTFSGDMLVFDSVNADYHRGFPAGSFLKESD